MALAIQAFFKIGKPALRALEKRCLEGKRDAYFFLNKLGDFPAELQDYKFTLLAAVAASVENVRLAANDLELLGDRATAAMPTLISELSRMHGDGDFEPFFYELDDEVFLGASPEKRTSLVELFDQTEHAPIVAVAAAATAIQPDEPALLPALKRLRIECHARGAFQGERVVLWCINKVTGKPNQTDPREGVVPLIRHALRFYALNPNAPVGGGQLFGYQLRDAGRVEFENALALIAEHAPHDVLRETILAFRQNPPGGKDEFRRFLRTTPNCGQFLTFFN